RKSIILGEHEVMGFLGGRERQRTLRSEQAKKFDEKLQRLVVPLYGAGKIGGRKIHVGILPELNVLLPARCAVTGARGVLVHALEMAQHREIIDPPRLSLEIAQEGHSHLTPSIIAAYAFPCGAAIAPLRRVRRSGSPSG